MSVRRGGVLTLLGTALLVLSGCGNVADDDVARVATAFAQDGQDAAARCALLAPTTLATLTSSTAATERTASPERTRATARSRKSNE